MEKPIYARYYKAVMRPNLKLSVGVLNCGNNLTSVFNALNFLEVNWVLVEDAKCNSLSRVSHLVMPGVGAFSSGMKALETTGLSDLVQERLKKGTPIMGVCLGMQLLFELGMEGGQTSGGLRILPGHVSPLRSSEDKRVPNVGWRKLIKVKDSLLLKGVDLEDPFFFLHSYAVSYQAQDFVTAISSHEEDFVSVIEKDNLFGVQFHPEKSSHAGTQVLRNFLFGTTR